MTAATLIDRRSFDAAALLREHPPRFTHPNKRAVLSALLTASDRPQGTVEVTRFADDGLPETFPDHRVRVSPVPGFFEYGQKAGPGTMSWHVNFAAGDAFRFYAGNLLAQDELQVLEHPVLGSLREAADTLRFSLVCTEDDGAPTPVLVTGVERRGALDTFPSAACPDGLYGNRFSPAPVKDVLAAVRRLEPPPLTNILAIEAPRFGRGTYDRATIATVLLTAYTGFAAAVAETRRRAPGGTTARCIVHTGHWGTGAYGGNHELMAVLQLHAADLAGMDEFVFYLGNGHGEGALGAALERRNAVEVAAPVEAVIDRLTGSGYRWGTGNET